MKTRGMFNRPPKRAFCHEHTEADRAYWRELTAKSREARTVRALERIADALEAASSPTGEAENG